MLGILIFGDSISLGRGESPNIGWSGRLKSDFESHGFHNVIFNLSVPGETSTKLLKRLETEAKSRVRYIREEDKFTIIIAVGLNDSRGLGSLDKPEVKPAKFEKNISKLINIAKKYTRHVAVLGLTPVDEEKASNFEGTFFANDQIKAYDNIIKDSAKYNKVHFIDIFDAMFRLDVKNLLVDGLHPNKYGYEEMYKIIKDDLRKTGMI